MKIGLDTNLLVRFITDDDPDQANLVENLFKSFDKKGAVFLINEVVLAELDWVLTHIYDYPKKDFLKTIDRLFKTENIAFNTPDLVKQASKLYSKSNADFADCLIGILNQKNNCDTTYTFDRKASGLHTFTLLK